MGIAYKLKLTYYIQLQYSSHFIYTYEQNQ